MGAHLSTSKIEWGIYFFLNHKTIVMLIYGTTFILDQERAFVQFHDLL